MAKQGKRLKAIYAGLDTDRAYPLAEAISLAKANAKAKFDETIELSMNLGIDPRHADQMVRGVVGLPNGTGKTVRVGVFARGPKAEEATAAGADVVGADDLAELVQAGKIDFDRCIATPDMMALVGRLGKILGPRGLMPNPRLGTVTMDVTLRVASRARAHFLPPRPPQGGEGRGEGGGWAGRRAQSVAWAAVAASASAAWAAARRAIGTRKGEQET